MDKITFRRKCLEDPHTADLEFRNAWRHDPELEAFRQSVLKTDDQLREALNVPIPTGLAARLELGRLLDKSSRPVDKSLGKSIKPPLALAASFVLAIVVGVWAFSGSIFGLNKSSVQVAIKGDIDSAYYEQVNMQIAEAVIDHAGHERWGGLDATPEKYKYFTELVVEYDLPDTASEFTPKYAEHCPVLGQRALHALLKGEKSDVTLVVLPNHMTDLDSDMVVDDHYVHVQPIGSGTLILSSESQTDLSQSLSHFTVSVDTTSVDNDPELMVLAF